MVFANNLTRK